MSAQQLNKSYALAALLIHGSNQTVTADKIKAVFAELGLTYSSKLAQKFELSAEKYSDLLLNASSAAVAPAAAEEKKEEKVKEVVKEESEDDVMLDF